MSILFNGTTSKLEHTTADLLSGTTFTVCFWCYGNTTGEGGAGRIFTVPEAGTTRIGYTAANTLRFGQDFTTTDGLWDFPVTDAAWNAVSITYDRGSTANDPVVRVNFTNVTVTRTVGPSGSSAAWTGGFCIGNVSSAALTWDGRIAHFQAYPGQTLAAGLQDQALRRPGSLGALSGSWFPMYHATFLHDLRGSVATPTATALATADGPPCAPHHFMRAIGWRGNIAGAAAPAGWGPLLSQSRNKLVVLA